MQSAPNARAAGRYLGSAVQGELPVFSSAIMD